MNDVLFSKSGWEEYISWQTEDRKIIKKINGIIRSIMRDGALGGEGKPEKLKHSEGEYSRRIDGKNRIIYRVPEEGKVEIVSCKGHYGGK